MLIYKKKISCTAKNGGIIMIVPLTNENENVWAEMCVALWPDLTIDEVLRMNHDGLFKYEFLYFEGTEPVAFLSLSLRSDYVEGSSSSPVGYIEGIYVKPEFRRKGIAEKLIDHAKEWSKKFDCSELASDCVLDNEANQAFHTGVGFTEANKIVCYIMQL